MIIMLFQVAVELIFHIWGPNFTINGLGVASANGLPHNRETFLKPYA